MTAYEQETMQAEMPAQCDWESVGGVFRSLGAPLRVGIVVLLQERSRSVTELVEVLGVSQPLVSQHLRVLRSAGMVRGRRQGREMIYSLIDPSISGLVVSAGRRVRHSRATNIHPVP